MKFPLKFSGKSEGFFVKCVFSPDIIFFHECIGCHVHDWICLVKLVIFTDSLGPMGFTRH